MSQTESQQNKPKRRPWRLAESSRATASTGQTTEFAKIYPETQGGMLDILSSQQASTGWQRIACGTGVASRGNAPRPVHRSTYPHGMTHGTGDTVRGIGSLGMTAGVPDHHPIYAANLLDIARLARMRKAVGLALQPVSSRTLYSPAARLRLP